MKDAQSISPEEDTTLTRKDLAERHKVCVETIKRRERSGMLRPLKIGRTVRYRLSDVLAIEAAASV